MNHLYVDNAAMQLVFSELTSIYEPIHGSAPDIAGLDLANPMGTILSAAMLLRYSLNEDFAAKVIENAIDNMLADDFRTADIYSDGFKRVGTEKVKEIICDNL